jgi:hypothetical protein
LPKIRSSSQHLKTEKATRWLLRAPSSYNRLRSEDSEIY